MVYMTSIMVKVNAVEYFKSFVSKKSVISDTTSRLKKDEEVTHRIFWFPIMNLLRAAETQPSYSYNKI